ncbi:hypothetical protein AcW2_007695 [Taiwanofungus camphoratus]|nr:hypothetical protein AcW2_007695 [Antrodia cinnamomea]
MGDALALGCEDMLNKHVPFPEGFMDSSDNVPWFHCLQLEYGVEVQDTYLEVCTIIPNSQLENIWFDLPNAYACAVRCSLGRQPFQIDDLEGELNSLFETLVPEGGTDAYTCIELSAAQLSAVQRNTATPRDFERLIPETIVVVVDVNGHPAWALLDSGSLADFMSTQLAHQLGVKSFELKKPLPVHLAVQGSWAKINLGCQAKVEYQSIHEHRYFDVINLLNYDLILGTPFLFQHQVTLGFNPTTVEVRSKLTLPLQGKFVRVLESRAAEIYEDKIEHTHQYLCDYAACICREAGDSPLPPLWAVNHIIPLKDPTKVYTWRPSKCPDALRKIWDEKREAYLKSGRWQMTNARNTSPMLLLRKPGTGVNGIPPALRTVCDT